jgi:transcription termination/antitermination protein NusA
MGGLTEEQVEHIVEQAERKAEEAERAAAEQRRRQKEQDRLDAVPARSPMCPNRPRPTSRLERHAFEEAVPRDSRPAGSGRGVSRER